MTKKFLSLKTLDTENVRDYNYLLTCTYGIGIHL